MSVRHIVYHHSEQIVLCHPMSNTQYLATILNICFSFYFIQEKSTKACRKRSRKPSKKKSMESSDYDAVQTLLSMRQWSPQRSVSPTSDPPSPCPSPELRIDSPLSQTASMDGIRLMECSKEESSFDRLLPTQVSENLIRSLLSSYFSYNLVS